MTVEDEHHMVKICSQLQVLDFTRPVQDVRSIQDCSSLAAGRILAQREKMRGQRVAIQQPRRSR